MRKLLNGFGRILMAGALLTASAAFAPAQETPKPDNTKTNKQDTGTADQQKNNKPDRETTKEIRQPITDDQSLSTYAHNVKVISTHGTVTFKRPCPTDSDTKSIGDKTP